MKIIFNKLKELNNIDFYLFCILFIFFTIKIFILNKHYIEHDELVNLTTYFYKETIFLKNFPNNHFFISLFGIIADFLFGTNLVLFKFINFLTLPLIFCILYFSFNKKVFIYILFSVYLFSDLLFVYSFILRGYYISSFLFCIIFYLLINNYRNKERHLLNLRFIYLICALQIINNISSIFLVAPILLAIFLNEKKFNLKEKINNFLLFFFIPLLILNSIQIILTGIYLNNYHESEKSMIILIINNFFKIYLSGFNNIYFANYTSVNLNTNLGNFVSQIKENSVIFLIFLFSFFISIFNFLKKKINIFDYIILYFFLFFILINKFPPDRVYVGIIYFFIFYLFFNYQNIEIRSKVLIYLFLSACFIQIILDKNIYREIATFKDKHFKINLLQFISQNNKDQNNYKSRIKVTSTLDQA